MKMKITRGNCVLGVLKYVLSPLKITKLMGGNMSGSSVSELAKEFAISLDLRPCVSGAVWHSSLALPAGEELNDEKWGEMARSFLKLMGFDLGAHQYVVARHGDTPHDHIHIIVSRVSLAGRLWHGRNDVRKAINATQELEKIFGLTITPGLKMDEDKERSPSSAEIALYQVSGIVSDKQQIAMALDAARKDCPDLAMFQRRIQTAGVEMLPAGKSGKCSGMSYSIGGEDPIKASALGKKYGWGRFSKEFYDPVRDADLVAQLRVAAAARAVADQQNYIVAEHGGSEVAIDEQPKRRRTLDRTFVKKENSNEWVWKNRPDCVAMRDLVDRIEVVSTCDKVVKACMELSKERFGCDIKVYGSELFRRKAWLEGNLQGLNISGFEPAPADYQRLEQLKQAREEHNGEIRGVTTGCSPESYRTVGPGEKTDSGYLDLESAGPRPFSTADGTVRAKFDESGQRSTKELDRGPRDSSELSPDHGGLLGNGSVQAEKNLRISGQGTSGTVEHSGADRRGDREGTWPDQIEPLESVGSVPAELSKPSRSTDNSIRSLAISSDSRREESPPVVSGNQCSGSGKNSEARKKLIEQVRHKQLAALNAEQIDIEEMLEDLRSRNREVGCEESVDAYRKIAALILELFEQRNSDLIWTNIDCQVSMIMVLQGYPRNEICEAVWSASPGAVNGQPLKDDYLWSTVVDGENLPEVQESREQDSDGLDFDM